MPLTPKQRAFVREYLMDFNASAAAERAGYSPKAARQQGHRMLTNDDIQAELAKANDRLEQDALVTREQIIEGLLHEAQYAADDASHSARVSAWAHLGKHLGMFAEKQEHTGELAIRIIRE